MPRRRRLFTDGLSQHVIHRGNNRSAIFRATSDYRLFLDLLVTTARRCRVDVHGYVLMTNHFHLIVTPASKRGLPEMMQRVGRIYVRDFNKQYERTGTLWEDRYRASLIHDEKYWLTCLRYIELNPVRAGLAPSAELYEWSSYRAHAFGRRDPLLTPHRLFLAGGRTSVERQRAWQVTCGASIDEDALVTIRRAIRTGRPLKDDVAAVEQSTADDAPGA